MANDTIKISYQPLILTGSGTAPTIPSPSTLKPGDSGWDDSTNILVGQTAYNITENKYYIRTNSAIEYLKETMFYEYEQLVSSNVWNITHNLQVRPTVTVIDSAGTTVEGQVVHNSINDITITFSGGFTGKAYLT